MTAATRTTKNVYYSIYFVVVTGCIRFARDAATAQVTAPSREPVRTGTVESVRRDPRGILGVEARGAVGAWWYTGGALVDVGGTGGASVARKASALEVARGASQVLAESPVLAWGLQALRQCIDRTAIALANCRAGALKRGGVQPGTGVVTHRVRADA